MTVGPWRPIHLHTYTSRITDLRVRTDVSETLSSKISADLTVSSIPDSATATVVLKNTAGNVLKSANVTLDAKTRTGSVDLWDGELDLWWPVGYGKQVLYTVEVHVADKDGNVLDSRSQKIGARRVRVVQEPLKDDEGRTFLFEVNNVRIFCGGSNWYVK